MRPNTVIYIMDDASEDEVDDASAWLWLREFERRHPEIFGGY